MAKGSPCPWRWKQVALSRQAAVVSGDALLHIWKPAQGPAKASWLTQLYMTTEITATERLPDCAHTHTRKTFVHSHTLVLCFVQTRKDINPPSGPLICSQLAISLSIYNWENKAVLWLCFNLWQFLQFPTLNYWPLREEDRKLQRKAVTPHLSGGSTHFRYFHPLWSNGGLWKGPYATTGVWWYDLLWVCMCVWCATSCHSERYLDYFHLISPQTLGWGHWDLLSWG